MKPAIFVTGAGAGIGNATVRRFVRGGWCVGASDVDGAAVEKLAGELGADVVPAALDVVDATAFARAVAAFVAKTGRLDVMFNCAGIATVGDFESIPPERHAAIVDINVKGVINGALAALPFLRATPGARLISMCSASAIYGTASFASYSATKFAVKGLSEALSQEWARYGIRVMDVMPLFVKTGMVESMPGSNVALSRLGVHLSADDIARVIWKAAHYRGLPKVHWYPGIQTKALAISQKLLPALLYRASAKMTSGY